MTPGGTAHALRVLVDATALPAERGGVGRYVDELVQALADLGVRLAVVAQRDDVPRFAARLGDTPVLRAPAWARRPPARLVWEQTGLPLLLRRLHPDVLLSPHYTLPLANTGPGRAAQVVTVHDATFVTAPDVHTPVKARFFAAWIGLSAARADALVVPSRATRDEVVSHFRVASDRVSVVPHGVDHTRFRPPSPGEVLAARAWAGVPDSAAYVAFLGTLEPRKNIPALVGAFIDACRGRSDPPMLVLAGGRGWEEGMEAALAEVPGELCVRRPGFAPDELVAGLLGGAEVVAYPSLGEGFGLPVLEAMACGAPVLTTAVLSLPEVGGDAVAYAASPARGDLAAALAALLDDPGRRGDLAAAGRARAATFTWQAAARAHVGVFEVAIARARGGRRR